VSTSKLEAIDFAALGQPPRSPEVEDVAVEIYACWNKIGVQGDATCPELAKVVHCRNCPVHSHAALQLLDRPLLPNCRREWTEHFAQPKKTAAPVTASALVFRIRAEWLALPTQAFQEVAEHRPVHTLPHRRQNAVLGLVNIRGELLVCVSLARLLGLERTPPGHKPRQVYERLLVANWHGNRLVFPADEVRGIHRFQRSELKEPPAILAKSNLSYTQGLLPWQGRTVGFLDADQLFSSLNRSLT
jgi:chemotaxis-related protein WspD